MPLTLPAVPGLEAAVSERIKQKYQKYIYKHSRAAPGSEGAMKGERYEITAAVDLLRRNKLVNGNQISRWVQPGEQPQHITCGFNSEFDFVINAASFAAFAGAGIPALQGYLLGDAKNITGTYGPAVKSLLAYALSDPGNTAGLCFIGTRRQGIIWYEIITSIYQMLSDPTLTPGIAGTPWQTRAASANRPAGAAIVAHFAQYNTPALIKTRAQQNTRVINTELATFAGIYAVCYSVPSHGDEGNFRSWFATLAL